MEKTANEVIDIFLNVCTSCMFMNLLNCESSIVVGDYDINRVRNDFHLLSYKSGFDSHSRSCHEILIVL